MRVELQAGARPHLTAWLFTALTQPDRGHFPGWCRAPPQTSCVPEGAGIWRGGEEDRRLKVSQGGGQGEKGEAP